MGFRKLGMLLPSRLINHVVLFATEMHIHLLT